MYVVFLGGCDEEGGGSFEERDEGMDCGICQISGVIKSRVSFFLCCCSCCCFFM